MSTPSGKKDKPLKKKCEYCQELYLPARKWSRFCSGKCRQRAWEEANPRVKRVD